MLWSDLRLFGWGRTHRSDDWRVATGGRRCVAPHECALHIRMYCHGLPSQVPVLAYTARLSLYCSLLLHVPRVSMDTASSTSENHGVPSAIHDLFSHSQLLA
jgi:hypothetical protein